MELKLKELYGLFNREMTCRDRKIKGITVDTRRLKKGEVFVALKGENTDGHRFIKTALSKGAAAVINEKESGGKKIRVNSSKSALLKLARYYYGKFPGLRTIGITGSNGKTTVKELAAAMAKNKYKTIKSEKSYNNYIGMPLTVFRLKKGDGLLVAELGMNKKGEIKKLAECLDIGAAVINNVGRAHIGFFKNLREVAEAKFEITRGLNAKGALVLNRDEKFYGYLKKKAKKFKVVSFGKNKNSTVRITGVKRKKTGCVFTLKTGGKKARVTTSLKGEHNIYNIAAACAAVLLEGVPLSDAVKAASDFRMKQGMRFEEKSVKGARIINDCYNANPDSFSAALEALKAEVDGDFYIVSGDMLEQGAASADNHREIGKKIAGLRVKKFYAFGKNAAHLKKGYLSGGGKEKDVLVFRDRAKLKKEIKGVLAPGNTVFIKGSRGNRLEEIIKR